MIPTSSQLTSTLSAVSSNILNGMDTVKGAGVGVFTKTIDAAIEHSSLVKNNFSEFASTYGIQAIKQGTKSAVKALAISTVLKETAKQFPEIEDKIPNATTVLYGLEIGNLAYNYFNQRNNSKATTESEDEVSSNYRYYCSDDADIEMKEISFASSGDMEEISTTKQAVKNLNTASAEAELLDGVTKTSIRFGCAVAGSKLAAVVSTAVLPGAAVPAIGVVAGGLAAKYVARKAIEHYDKSSAGQGIVDTVSKSQQALVEQYNKAMEAVKQKMPRAPKMPQMSIPFLAGGKETAMVRSNSEKV